MMTIPVITTKVATTPATNGPRKSTLTTRPNAKISHNLSRKAAKNGWKKIGRCVSRLETVTDLVGASAAQRLQAVLAWRIDAYVRHFEGLVA